MIQNLAGVVCVGYDTVSFTVAVVRQSSLDVNAELRPSAAYATRAASACRTPPHC